ncbi:MAG: methyltransferase [Bacteroidales bacterium]|nr:methyltransferase [Bacteroidales bacterium]
MQKDIFKFKEFEIIQNDKVHKIGTDSILLGSWAEVEIANRILDVGTGTGVLALMLAQRSNALITAIDCDYNAYYLATLNIKNSKWASRIKVIHASLENFNTSEMYDVIVCNPPFYINQLKSPYEHRNSSKHTDLSFYEKLFKFSFSHLMSGGHLSIIIPFDIYNYLYRLIAETGLHVNTFTVVYPNPIKKPNRILLKCSKDATGITADEIIVESIERNVFTEQYYELTKKYHLNIRYV